MEDNLNKNSKTALLVISVKVIFFIGLLIGGFFLWIFGEAVILFSTVNQLSMSIFWSLLMLSLMLLIFSLLFRKARILRKWAGGFMLFFMLVLCLIPAYRWITVERFKQLNDRINWYIYDPWRVDTKVVIVEADDDFKILNDLPRIDGAYALYPIYSGVVRALYNKSKFEKNSWRYLQTNGSDLTFRRLLADEVDLIFSAPPSKLQLADAEAKSLKYEITPFAREAFVFFVNSKNPIDNLTSAQIRGIYSGKITDWSQIDPHLSGKIKPFQRNQGSGSQTMLEKIMGDTTIMPPLEEDRLGGMGGIINDVASYRNYQEAIGFTFRYFSTEMFKNGEIKLLSIDGVAPTVENIRNGTYPFIADCGIITVRPRSENIQKIVDFMFTSAGRELIEKTGYVPIERK